MAREPNVKTQIKDWLDSIGAWHYAVTNHGYGEGGIPDRCGVYRGRGFAIEAKSAGESLKALQVYQKRRC